MENIPDDDTVRKIINPKRYRLFFTKRIDEKVKDLGLSEGQVYFIVSLSDSEGISLRELTERVDVHKSLTTRTIKSLIENGFVIDTKESGKKEYSVILTDKGQKAKMASLQALKDVTAMVLGALTEKELRCFFDIIGKIYNRMDEIERSELSVQ